MSGITPVYYTDAGFTTVLKSSYDSAYDLSVNTTAGSFDNPYVNWSAKGYRLPTEGEWQFAASNKGGTPYNYLSGADADYTDDASSFAVGVFSSYSSLLSTGVTKTANVGTKNANQLAIYDMSGNIREFCWDRYDIYPGTSTDYRGPDSGSIRTSRGGRWDGGVGFCQVGSRSGYLPYNAGNNMGFRLARTGL